MTEGGSLLDLWPQYAGCRIPDVFIPAAWAQPLERDESAGVDVYDDLDE